MKKDCSVQYATSDRDIFVDTGLVTRAEAEDIFDSHVDDFIEKMKEGRSPEMVLWINMKDECSYGETAKHWHSDHMTIIDGVLYQLVRAL